MSIGTFPNLIWCTKKDDQYLGVASELPQKSVNYLQWHVHLLRMDVVEENTD